MQVLTKNWMLLETSKKEVERMKKEKSVLIALPGHGVSIVLYSVLGICSVSALLACIHLFNIIF
jgi:hypothetical protein